MIITGILAVVIFSICGRMIRGKYTFAISDCICQYAPAMKLFWSNIFHGKSILYSFNFSLGQETLPVFMFYGCFNPINVIYAFIGDVNIATMFVSVIKIMLASFTFYIYADKTTKAGRYEKSLFSLCYGLSSFFVIYYFNLMYLDGAYMLPLVMMQINGLIKKGKFVSLIFSYAYLFLFSFYAGYIIGIFSLIVVLTYSIADHYKDIKYIILNLAKLALSAIIALLISGILMYPTAMHVINNNDSSRFEFRGLNISIFDILGNMFIGQMQSLDGIYPMNYCGLLTLFVVVIYFISKNIDKKSKIKSAILLSFILLCSLVDGLYLFMHMFNSPDSFGHRFAYIFIFILLSIAVNNYEKISIKFGYKYIIIGGTFIGIYLLSHYFQIRKLNLKFVSSTQQMIEINIVFIIIYLLFFWKKNNLSQKIYRISIFAIVCIELIINGVVVVSRLKYNNTLTVDMYKSKQNEIYTANNIISTDNSLFYRVYYKNVFDPNFSQLYNYRALGSFNTIENNNLHETLYKLGYKASPARVIDYGGTALTRMIFGQKYLINGYIPLEENERDAEELVYKNGYSLSLGFMVPDNITDLHLDSNNPFENQNKLASYLLGENIALWDSKNIIIREVTDNTYMGVSENDETKELGDYYIIVEEGHAGDYSLEIDSDKDVLYGYIEVKESKDQSGTSPYLVSPSGDTGLWTEGAQTGRPHLTRLGRNSDGKYILLFHFTNETDDYVFFDRLDIAYEDDNVLGQIYDDLSMNQYNIVSFKDTYIEGKAEATNDKDVLLTTIPYSDNWKVYIDGVSGDTIPALNGTFVSVKLTEGLHDITFKYEDINIKTGAIITLIGIISLIVIIYADKRITKKDIE